MTQIDKSNKIIAAFVICLDLITINSLFLLFQAIYREQNIQLVEGKLVAILLSLSISYIISTLFTEVIIYYRRVRADQIIRKTITRMVAFTLVWLAIVSILDINITDGRAILYLFACITFVVAASRMLYYSMLRVQRKQGRNRCNAIYIGSGSNLVELYDEMALQLTTGYHVLGYFDKSPNEKFEGKCPYLGEREQALEYLKINKVDRVYCSLQSNHSDIILPIINFCESHLVRFFSVPNLRNYCQRRVSLEMFSNVPLLTIREEPLNLVTNRIAKRAFDILFSLCFLCTAFLPIYIVVGIITKITSPGPIFFKQKRHGLDGKEFYMYKFRSMKVNKDADTLQATKDDPRKTKFGDFLRKTSIDELPQFINVLLGDMSIVGPRPHMVLHTEQYSKLINSYMVRHYIKPGVTGWAQVTGFRGETKELSEMEGRVKADIWYLEHWTFTLDLYIIYKTVANVVSRKDTKAF